MNRFHTFVNWLFIFLVVALVIAAIYVTAKLAQESFNNYIEPPAIATIRAATPTITPEYVPIMVKKLFTEKRDNNDLYWVVSESEEVYLANTQAWLILEIGKCYHVSFYYYGDGTISHIRKATSAPCEEQ